MHEVVGEAAHVGEQILDPHRPLTGIRQEVRIAAAAEDAQIAPLRNPAMDRIVQLEMALLEEHHQGDRRDRLGHRVDPEDRVLAHRLAALEIHQPDRLAVLDPPSPMDEGQEAGNLAGLDVAFLQMGADPRELLRIESAALVVHVHRLSAPWFIRSSIRVDRLASVRRSVGRSIGTSAYPSSGRARAPVVD
jgi:hypothetical protein